MRAKHPDHKKTYHVWYTMLWRCKQTKGHFYKYYGSRGIEVCDRWKVLENFIEDMGYKPKGMSLDRIDNSKGYSPENCRWISMWEQSNNRRNNIYQEVNGKSLTLSQWAKELELPYDTVKYHFKKGQPHFSNYVTSLQAKQ